MSVDTRPRAGDRALDRRLMRQVLNLAGNPRISVRLWNGEEIQNPDSRPVACMELRKRHALLKLLSSPSVGFGECYSQGLIEIHGDFLAFANEATAAYTRRTASQYLLPRLRARMRALRRNDLSRSKHNVHRHYDLGNDFYRLWLDENMVYTCAYYDNPSATLAEAQVAKLEHVCRKLNLRPGQHVVEAGCGWGALALHMAEHHGVRVTAYNNSHEQVAYAREQAAARKLDRLVTFVEDDYRNISDRYDVFVSVGMLEHVGFASYRALGELIQRCLRPDGFGLIHTIGRSYPDRADPWILKHVFPGGHIPSLGEMTTIFEPQHMSILDVENLRLHYARTCRMWLENFEAVTDQVAKMYSEEFVRMWRLYLAGSSAGFRTGTLQLYQVLFAPLGNNDVPWTREYQYLGTAGSR